MKKLVKGVLIFVVLFLIVLVVGSVYMFGVALDRKVTAADEENAYQSQNNREDVKSWIDSLKAHSALKDTFIIAEDGANLHALYVRSTNKSPKTALLIHGYTGNSIGMLMIGHIYNLNLDYNLLLPDLRAHGKSGGESIQMGWKDRLDVLRWMDVAKDLYGDTTQMVVHGISMGAAAAMMVSGEELSDNVKCFVEDCGYTSVWDEFSHNLKVDYGLPEFPLMHATSLYCEMKEGWNFKEASSLEQVKKCKRPMLFIHGGADTYVPTWMVYDLYEAKEGEKELWVIPDVRHGDAYWAHTDEYTERVLKFAEKHMD